MRNRLPPTDPPDGARGTTEARANIAKGNEAIERILRDRGSVPAAMMHPELGPITFDWGEPGDPAKGYDGGWGVSHVLARHGEAVLREIPKVIASGKTMRRYGPPNAQRVDISEGTHTAVLSLYRFGKQETWLLTGWKEKGPDGPGSDSALSGPTPLGPTLNRPEGGAGPIPIIGATGPEVKAAAGSARTGGGPAQGPVGVVHQPSSGDAESPSHAVEAREVHFAYRKGEPVLRGVSLVGPAGRLLCLLGPNGSGKTTLLRCLLGLLRPAGGAVLLDGADVRDISPRQLARLVAYVPQVPASAFSFTVGEIVLMGRFSHAGLMGLASEQDLAVARAAMRMTGVLELADRTLEELSGGQAQCAMIARALAQQPAVILLDEPTSHLDIRNQLSIHRMMQRLAHDWGMAVVCVSHDVNLAARFADELILMRDGAVVAAGTSAEVIRRDVLEKTYGVGIELVPAEVGVPIVVGH